MSSIVGIVALLAVLLLARSLVRAWNRQVDALLEQHLGRASEAAGDRTGAELRHEAQPFPSEG